MSKIITIHDNEIKDISFDDIIEKLTISHINGFTYPNHNVEHDIFKSYFSTKRPKEYTLYNRIILIPNIMNNDNNSSIKLKYRSNLLIQPIFYPYYIKSIHTNKVFYNTDGNLDTKFRIFHNTQVIIDGRISKCISIDTFSINSMISALKYTNTNNYNSSIYLLPNFKSINNSIYNVCKINHYNMLDNLNNNLYNIQNNMKQVLLDCKDHSYIMCDHFRLFFQKNKSSPMDAKVLFNLMKDPILIKYQENIPSQDAKLAIQNCSKELGISYHVLDARFLYHYPNKLKHSHLIHNNNNNSSSINNTNANGSTNTTNTIEDHNHFDGIEYLSDCSIEYITKHTPLILHIENIDMILIDTEVQQQQQSSEDRNQNIFYHRFKLFLHDIYHEISNKIQLSLMKSFNTTSTNSNNNNDNNNMSNEILLEVIRDHGLVIVVPTRYIKKFNILFLSIFTNEISINNYNCLSICNKDEIIDIIYQKVNNNNTNNEIENINNNNNNNNMIKCNTIISDNLMNHIVTLINETMCGSYTCLITLLNELHLNSLIDQYRNSLCISIDDYITRTNYLFYNKHSIDNYYPNLIDEYEYKTQFYDDDMNINNIQQVLDMSEYHYQTCYKEIPYLSPTITTTTSTTSLKSKYNGSTNTSISPVYWSDIGGLDDIRREVLDMIELPYKYPLLYLSKHIPRRQGILLYGPPGTGKTLVAKAVATECKIGFISVKGPELLDSYIGESERNIRELFTYAKEIAPCVLFFDEIDSLAPARATNNDSSGGVMDRIVSQLLTEIDLITNNCHNSTTNNNNNNNNNSINDNNSILNTNDKLVFIIAATNRPDLLDPSLLRPGRFDRKIYLGTCKNVESRVQILQAQTRKFHLSEDVNLLMIAYLLPENVTGADIGGMTSTAFSFALDRKLFQVTEQALQNKSIINTIEDDDWLIRSYVNELSEEALIVMIGLEDFIKAIQEMKSCVIDVNYYESLNQLYNDVYAY